MASVHPIGPFYILGERCKNFINVPRVEAIVELLN